MQKLKKLGQSLISNTKWKNFKYMQEEIHFHQELLNLHYLPVVKSDIDQVHISINSK